MVNATRRPASKGPCFHGFFFLFMRASFSVGSLSLWGRAGVRENKKPFIHIRDEEFSPRYHPDSFGKRTLFVAVTGFPGADYLISPAQLLL